MAINNKSERQIIRKAMRAMRPTGVTFTVDGGGIYPVADGISLPSGYRVGLHCGVTCRAHWEVSLGGSLNEMNFELERFDVVPSVPEVAPPSESFDFITAEVIRPFITLDLQANYELMANKSFCPFFESGFRMMITQPYEVLYDFRNPNTGLTWTYENTPKGEAQLSAQAMMGVGLCYR